MLAFEEMLVAPADEAGIKVPEEPEKYDPELFPHWHVFCNVQLGRPMPNADSHWRNAEVIAAVPEERIRLITLAELVELGVE